jgi:hypothetical protein
MQSLLPHQMKNKPTIPNNKSKHVCNYCLKEYSRKILYSRHIILCELNSKSKREKTCEEEEHETIPSQREMYHILLELAKKNAVLEEKLAEIQKWVNVKKQKFNAVEWLFKNKTPTVLFKDFIQRIVVDEEVVQLLMEENIFKTITKIFDKNEFDTTITAFSQKANVIYIYDNTTTTTVEEDTEITWRRMTPNDFHRLLQNIHRKIVMTVCEWYNKNKETLTQNEKQMMKYHAGLNKLMSAEFHRETALVGKLRCYLYNQVKMEVDVVQVELEF